MKQVVSSEKLPIKMWLDEIEEGALNQAKNLANLPFAFHHIALMADAHQGFGMPIGGVLATDGVVIPNAVDVDIGCGMCAVKTSLKEIDKPTLKKILGKIREKIPVGFGKHDEPQDAKFMPKGNLNKNWGTGDWNLNNAPLEICSREYENALKSLGTLGGGNHFIEIQRGTDGHIWIMIHSGSRNLGLQVATHYNKIAKKLNARWHSVVDSKQDLAFLPLETDVAHMYLAEMKYCVDYALANRQLMMDRIMDIFINETNCTFVKDNICPSGMINIAHNYAEIEHHFGRNVIVHRKGATLATEETIGIIPGSQGAKSYIVRGKGNKDSFNSCSHGAGRRLGRREAVKSLNLASQKRFLDNQGILHSLRSKDNLDEAPAAYKDIKQVIANQADLIEIKVELTPLGVVKG